MTSTLDRFSTARDLRGEEGVQLPPGPSLPAIAQSLLFLTRRSQLMPRWRRRYGDVFTLQIAPTGTAVVLSRPEHIREVFAGASDVFHAGEGNAILGPVMGEHSVLLLDEDAHLAARKKVMAAFRGEAMRGYGPVIEQLAADQVASWPENTPFPVHQHMNDISLEVILRIVFGVTDEARLEVMRPLLGSLVRVGPAVVLSWMYPALMKVGPGRRFALLKAETDKQIYAEIADRRRAPDLAARTDVLSKLIAADPAHSDEELRDHLVTLLLAGHETTASTLAWAFHDLARQPAAQARLRRAADEDDEQYLEAAVKEALRRRPVISEVARRLKKPVRVAGYDLPAGVTVFPSIELVQHTPSLYPSPEEFRPERFLGAAPAPATWIPFGGGIRRCLGAALAMQEAHAVLKVVLRTVEILPGGPAESERTRNVTTVPSKGARIVVRRR